MTTNEAAKVLRDELPDREKDLLDALVSTGGQGISRTVTTLLLKAVIAEASALMRNND